MFQIFLQTICLKEVIHPSEYTNFTLKQTPLTLYYFKNYPLRITGARACRVSKSTFGKYAWRGKINLMY